MKVRRRAVVAWGLVGLGGMLPLGRIAAASEQRLVTANLPPFAIEDQSEHRGALVEVAEAVLARAGFPARAEFFPWARSQLLVAQGSRVLIVPLARTPEREAQYQWLLKLYTVHQQFIKQQGEPRIQSFDQARSLRVGVLRGSPDLAILRRQQFADERIVQAASAIDLLRLLERHHVDVIFGADIIYATVSSTRPGLQLSPGARLGSTDIWLAGGAGFDAEDRQRLAAAHAALLKDGSIERIFRRYGLRPAPEDLR